MQKQTTLMASLLFCIASGSVSAQIPPARFSQQAADMGAALFGPFSAPIEPFKIVGNIYYVGGANIASYLITTPKGHFLLDTGTTLMGSYIPRHIEKLGFKATDVKVLLNSHAHVDHIQGHAAMQRATGAAVMAMEADVPAMTSGKDLSPIEVDGWEPIPVARVLRDNDEVSLGGMTMRAIWAPGHTPGNTTWVTEVQDGDRRYQIVFGGPPIPVVDNPRWNTRHEDAMTSFRRLRELKPDIVLEGHPQASFAGKLDQMRTGQRPHPMLLKSDEWATRIRKTEDDYLKRRASPVTATP